LVQAEVEQSKNRERFLKFEKELMWSFKVPNRYQVTNPHDVATSLNLKRLLFPTGYTISGKMEELRFHGTDVSAS
jgi:hypothetical protein